MFTSTTSRKQLISRSELANVGQTVSSPSFDDSLFLAILLTSFHGLMHLGELTWPDTKHLQDYRKVIFRSFLQVSPKSYQFVLPGHKADWFLQGNIILFLFISSFSLPSHPPSLAS
jgi:hypothetical protein